MGPEEIEERARALYGEVDWTEATGLLHVAAIHGPTRRILAIGPDSPPSPTDRFVLGLARARADVVVTTGGILRAEPELVHRYAEDEEEEDALRAWRDQRLARAARPSLLVLSATGRFPKEHPAFASARGWIWTSASGAAEIGRPPPGFEVVQADAERATALDALMWLRGEVETRGADGTILLEAGPTTTRAFYAPDSALRVQELLLSSFEGAIEASVEGPGFVEARALEAAVGTPRSSRRIEEASGAWTFERFRRE